MRRINGPIAKVRKSPSVSHGPEAPLDRRSANPGGSGKSRTARGAALPTPHAGAELGLPAEAEASAMLTAIEARARRTTGSDPATSPGKWRSSTISICRAKSPMSRLPVTVSEPPWTRNAVVTLLWCCTGPRAASFSHISQSAVYHSASSSPPQASHASLRNTGAGVAMKFCTNSRSRTSAEGMARSAGKGQRHTPNLCPERSAIAFGARCRGVSGAASIHARARCARPDSQRSS